jgi:DNA-binding NarL/FixJ family response regulator
MSVHIGAATGSPFSAATDARERLRCNPSEMRESVVIVDDNDAFRARTRALLDAEGYDVLGEADDGAGGLRLLRELRPDLALLDVQLPDTDGFTLAERLHAGGGDTAVIIISTREADDYASSVARCGALGFISKSELCGAAMQQLVAGMR